MPSKFECANGTSRIIEDSLNSKFDFWPIISEREEKRERRLNDR